MPLVLPFQPKFQVDLKVLEKEGREWSKLDAGKGVSFKFGSFVTTLRSLFERLNYTREEAVIGVAFHVQELLQRITERTPVDQSPEADDIVAKDLWDLDVNQSGDSVTWKLTNKAINPDNDYPYPAALEYGWSPQAPNGMIRISLEEFRMEIASQLKILKSGGRL